MYPLTSHLCPFPHILTSCEEAINRGPVSNRLVDGREQLIEILRLGSRLFSAEVLGICSVCDVKTPRPLAQDLRVYTDLWPSVGGLKG